MKWTKKRNPSLYEIQYIWELPWLEFIDERKCAYFEVSFNSIFWIAKFWHGNHGYSIDNWARHKTRKSAENACIRHFKKIRSAVLAENPQESRFKKQKVRQLT